jgi:hypothetical protein
MKSMNSNVNVDLVSKTQIKEFKEKHFILVLENSALIHAAHLCSNAHDFNLERLHIEISLLLGQYPLTFISNQFLRFFQVNQHVYQQLINRITQCKRKQRINEKSCKISNSITEKII